MVGTGGSGGGITLRWSSTEGQRIGDDETDVVRAALAQLTAHEKGL